MVPGVDAMPSQNTDPHRAPELDEETYRLAQQLFQVIRSGDTEQVERLLAMGLVPNLRDAKGNSQIGRAHSELQSRPHLVCRLLLEKKKVFQLYELYCT